MQAYYLGVDIGTYESKAALVDESGALAATAKCGHGLMAPRPGYAEHDAERDWWGDFCRLSREVLQAGGVPAGAVRAVAASGIAPCCLPVDENLKPLRNAILYGIDVRAAAQIEEIKRRLGAENILAKYANPLTSQSVIPKIVWLRENEPEVYHGAAKFLTCSSYLVAKLTGEYTIDRYTAGTYVPAYDLAAQNWDVESLRNYCPPEKLPRCAWTTDVAGTIHARAAAETGLAEGTPVIVGTADASAEATSAGVVNPGDFMLMFGSSIFMIQINAEARSDRRIWAGPYLFEGTHSLAAGMSTAGTLTRWFKDNFARELVAKEAAGLNVYDALMEEARDIPAGAGGLIALPYFSGERTPINDPLAKGMLFGLNLTHQRAHIYKALLEGVGYGIAQHLDIFAGLGVPVQKLVAVGGGTKNSLWMQVVADICQTRVHTAAVGQGASYGSALLAAIGCGGFAGAAQAAGVVRPGRTYEPDAKTAPLYGRYKDAYRQLYEDNKNMMHNL